MNAFRRDDLDAWLSTFATSVTFAADATVGLGRQVLELRDRWEHTLIQRRQAAGRKRPRSDSALISSLDCLADMPAFHTRDLAERLQVTWRAAQDAVQELEAASIVEQVSAGKGNRLYEVMEVFSLLDRFENDPAAFTTA